MNILLIGSGGREHALAHKLTEGASRLGEIVLYAAPGNPGVFSAACPADIVLSNHDSVIKFCREHDIEFVVVGPENPLADGLADDLRAEGLVVFGPSQAAAQLESSKHFAKEFMRRHNIPTAQFRTFHADEYDEARKYVAEHPLPVVIKADGLAAGKGVTVATTRAQAAEALEETMSGRFGSAGNKVVIEEFMHGEEASVFAISDGERFITLAPAQDHKRIGDGDTGDNTGGMGAYCPAPLVNDEVMEKIHRTILDPVLRGMKSDGMPFVGCLYAGLMLHKGEPRVVEFNARFGDPETQAVLAVLDADFPHLLYSAACGNVDTSAVRNVAQGFACCVVLAASGYPGEYRRGDEITGIDHAERTNARVFHAGTELKAGKIRTNGGRVLGITHTGATLQEAIEKTYSAAHHIHFRGKTFRTDIGAKGLRK